MRTIDTLNGPSCSPPRAQGTTNYNLKRCGKSNCTVKTPFIPVLVNTTSPFLMNDVLSGVASSISEGDIFIYLYVLHVN